MHGNENSTQFQILHWEFCSQDRLYKHILNFGYDIQHIVFFSVDGRGANLAPPRNQCWSDMRYYVAIEQSSIDRFRACMQKD